VSGRDVEVVAARTTAVVVAGRHVIAGRLSDAAVVVDATADVLLAAVAVAAGRRVHDVVTGPVGVAPPQAQRQRSQSQNRGQPVDLHEHLLVVLAPFRKVAVFEPFFPE